MTKQIRSVEFIVLPTNRIKARKKLAKVSRKIANMRRNWVHQTAKEIVGECGTVAVEGLNVKDMTASAKGTVENPGRNVRKKTGFNREILDTTFAGIRRNLEYKCGRLIEVHPAYTSQTCSQFGHTDKENRKTQPRIQCVCCGLGSNADTNTAINIRRLEIARLHGQGVALANPANRETDTRLSYG